MGTATIPGMSGRWPYEVPSWLEGFADAQGTMKLGSNPCFKPVPRSNVQLRMGPLRQIVLLENFIAVKAIPLIGVPNGYRQGQGYDPRNSYEVMNRRRFVLEVLRLL